MVLFRSKGAPGGILLILDRRVVEKMKCVGEFTVCCSLRNVKNQFTWAFAGVCGPNFDIDISFFMGRIGWFAKLVELGVVYCVRLQCHAFSW